MIRVWDSKVLKQRERVAREEALEAQSEADWKFAVLQLERVRSDLEYGFVDCLLPACRRAKRCTGNPPICTARCELEPGADQDLIEEFYANIQEDRREDRVPLVESVLDYVQQNDEEIDEIDEPRPCAGRKLPIVKEAVRKDAAPVASPPEPQPPSPKLELPPPVPPPLESPPPEPATAAWEPKISPEQEERINQIWADYVAGKPMPRPEPRIRLLSDDNDAWGVPPWWKGRR